MPSRRCSAHSAAVIRWCSTAEDIHWADDATVELLAHVAAQAERIPLLLIVSSRTDSDAINRIRNEAMDATTHDARRSRRRRRCSRSSSRSAARCRTQPPRRSVARAHGNPFFAVEMVRAVARGEAVGTSDDLPPTIESALASTPRPLGTGRPPDDRPRRRDRRGCPARVAACDGARGRGAQREDRDQGAHRERVPRTGPRSPGHAAVPAHARAGSRVLADAAPPCSRCCTCDRRRDRTGRRQRW